MERWKEIPGFEGYYEASDHGRIRNIKKAPGRRPGHIKMQSLAGPDKRPVVALSKDSVIYQTAPGRLVLQAFVGPCPQGMCACHNDGNPHHNHLSNLRWDTYKNNTADMVRHGTVQCGEISLTAKLTAKDVLEIRNDTRLQALIAADYGVSVANISMIKARKAWKHI